MFDGNPSNGSFAHTRLETDRQTDGRADMTKVVEIPAPMRMRLQMCFLERMKHIFSTTITVHLMAFRELIAVYSENQDKNKPIFWSEFRIFGLVRIFSKSAY
jgi:hypothetical protein